MKTMVTGIEIRCHYRGLSLLKPKNRQAFCWQEVARLFFRVYYWLASCGFRTSCLRHVSSRADCRYSLMLFWVFVCLSLWIMICILEDFLYSHFYTLKLWHRSCTLALNLWYRPLHTCTDVVSDKMSTVLLFSALNMFSTNGLSLYCEKAFTA